MQERFLQAEQELLEAVNALERFRSASQTLDSATGSVNDATRQLGVLGDRLREIGAAVSSGAEALRQGVKVLEQADVGRLERSLAEVRTELHVRIDRLESLERDAFKGTGKLGEDVQSLKRSMDEKFSQQETAIAEAVQSLASIRMLAIGSIVLLVGGVLIGALVLNNVLSR